MTLRLSQTGWHALTIRPKGVHSSIVYKCPSGYLERATQRKSLFISSQAFAKLLIRPWNQRQAQIRPITRNCLEHWLQDQIGILLAGGSFDLGGEVDAQAG